MSEYESNIDFSDVFDCFMHNKEDSSQILQFHSHYQLSSGRHRGSFESQLENKKQVPTSDQNITRDLCQSPHAIPQIKIKTCWLSYQSQVRKRNEAVRQGSKDDTVELNINFKTIIYNHFKELLLANELTPVQQLRLSQFGSRSPSFKSLLLFCTAEPHPHNAEISQICRAFVESSLIVRRIMESKCKMVTKINMVKFVEILRRNLRGDGKITKWKSALRR